MVLIILPFLFGTKAFAKDVAKPKFSYKNKVVTKKTKVYIYSKTKGAKIYYTVDGSTPIKGAEGTKRYSSKGIGIKKTTTIKAVVYFRDAKSKVAKLTIVLLKPIKIKKLSVLKNDAYLEWNPVRFVGGYYVYRRKSGSSNWEKVKKIKGASRNTYLDRNVKLGKKYSYIVIPYKGKKKLKLKNRYSKSIIMKCSHDIDNVYLSEGYYTIEKCSICGKEIDRYLSKDIPSYWNAEITASLDAVKRHGNLIGYVYLTDTHWKRNAKNSPSIINFVCSKLGNMLTVFGGDAIYNHQDSVDEAKSEILDFYSKFTGPIFSTTGNHDFNKVGNTNLNTRLTSADLFPIMYQRESGYAHLDGGSDYSYLDDYHNKVRMISFLYDDSGSVPKETIEWIGTRVKELPAGWTVVLFSHAYWTFSVRGTGLGVKNGGKKLASDLLKIQQESNACIALWHVGHVHRDYSEVIRDGNDSILAVSTSCDNYVGSYRWGGPQMTRRTATEQAVDVVQIDTRSRKIYMTRVGAGSDRVFSY